MSTTSTTLDVRPAISATVSALSDRELLAQTRNLARVERHLQGAIIDHLAEIDARSLFLRRGYSSLFEYAEVGRRPHSPNKPDFPNKPDGTGPYCGHARFGCAGRPDRICRARRSSSASRRYPVCTN